MSDDRLRLEYVPLSELKRWERNPKDHDLGELGQSFRRFGYVSPIIIDEGTGRVAAGHGRLDELTGMKARGDDPPARVVVDNGDWQVPVVRGIAFNDELEMEAYAVADNRLVERGGWNEPELLQVLVPLLGGPGLGGVGFDADDVDALAAFTSMMGDWKLPDLEWDEPIKAWRVIVQCDTSDEVVALLRFLGLDDSDPTQVRYKFVDTRAVE